MNWDKRIDEEQKKLIKERKRTRRSIFISISSIILILCQFLYYKINYLEKLVPFHFDTWIIFPAFTLLLIYAFWNRDQIRQEKDQEYERKINELKDKIERLEKK